MRDKLGVLLIGMFVTIALVACGGKETEINNDGNNSDKLQIVTSFTIIEDMVKEIGGDFVEVHNLVPTGTDPHEYSPLPNDIKAATDADVLFYNGLNLEGGEHGWFARMIDATGQDWAAIYELAKGVKPMYLTTEDGREEEINPHAFLDPVVGIEMCKNVRDALIEVDHKNEAMYEKNAEVYLKKLIAINEQYQTLINKIPEENRILVTSERAFQYMADRYGLKEGYLWTIDTEENGSPEQIKALLTLLEESSPPVLFVETNVDKRPMETISKESGIEIFGEVFSDEIGKPGEEVDTYLQFLKHNIEIIYEGLKEK